MYGQTLDTVSLPDVDFDLMGLPFVLHTSIPITVGWNMDLTATLTMRALVSAHGSVQWGIR